MKDKLQKKDMTFLLALAGFGFLCVLRYYNENMMQHLWALSILGNRRIIQGMTAVFFLILIGVAGQALRKVSKENRSGIYYMATLLAVCLMPMFICDSYMGSPDLYAWVIILLCIVALLDGRCDGIVLPGILLAAYICPMIVFSGGALLFAAVLAKGMCEDNKRNMAQAAGMVVMTFVAFVLAKETYGFAADVQGRISGKRFLVIVLLFLPYTYAIFCLSDKRTDRWTAQAGLSFVWSWLRSGLFAVGLSGRLLPGGHICFCILPVTAVDPVLSGSGISDIMEYISTVDQRKSGFRAGCCDLSIDHSDILDGIQ